MIDNRKKRLYNKGIKNKKSGGIKKMLQKTVYELLSEVIQGISGNLNKKALKEVMEDNNNEDYNIILKAYYDRIHRVNNHGRYYFSEFASVDEFGSEEEFKEFLKDNGVKWYKSKYNYNMNELQPIKQKNTGFVMLVNNGFITHGHYLFDVNEFIKYNHIEVIE